MEPTQGNLTKTLLMNSVKKSEERKLKNGRTAVATFKELNSFLRWNGIRQARCSDRIIQRIIDLKNDDLQGCVQKFLITEENLITLQDVCDFFCEQNFDLSVLAQLEDVVEHWYKRVRQEDIHERIPTENVSASESNPMTVEGTVEGTVEKTDQNSDQRKSDLMKSDAKTSEAKDGSNATNTLHDKQKIDNERMNETASMKSDLGDAVTKKEMDKDKGEVEEEKKRKMKNVEEKLGSKNCEMQGSKAKNARKTQEEVKRGLHWKCSVCPKGYTRKNLCQDHIRIYHPKGGAQVKKMNGQAQNIDERLSNDIISYPNPQQREDESHRDPRSSSGLISQSVEETQTSGHQNDIMETTLYVVDENGVPCEVVLENSMAYENVTMYSSNEDVPCPNENGNNAFTNNAMKDDCKIYEESSSELDDLFNVEGAFGNLAYVN